MRRLFPGFVLVLLMLCPVQTASATEEQTPGPETGNDPAAKETSGEIRESELIANLELLELLEFLENMNDLEEMEETQ